MSPFIRLSDELQLSIIQFLGNRNPDRSSDISANSNNYQPSWDPFRPNQDLINLSSCCKVLRHLIAPTIFQEIRLRNDDTSGHSVRAVSNSMWATRVRTLHFECLVLPKWRYLESPTPMDNNLSPSVEDALSNLHRLPQLNTLTIQFMFGKHADDDDRAFADLAFDYDGQHHVDGPEVEKQFPWRALMTRIYDIITHSNHTALTSIELRNFSPYGISSWTTEAWHRFLGNLKDVSMYLRGCDNGAGWQVNKTDSYYMSFVERLESMFQQMDSVTHLRFVAAENGPLGLSGLMNHYPLSLLSTHLPSLEVLELQFCFVSMDLATFIVDHSKTLKRVHLKYCFSSVNCVLAEENTSWAAFFNAVAEGIESVENVTLAEFLVSPSNPLFGQSEDQDNVRNGIPIEGYHTNVAEVEVVRKGLQDNSQSRLFAHATLDDKYGMVFTDERGNGTSFLEGQDQMAFDRLMSMIERKT